MILVWLESRFLRELRHFIRWVRFVCPSALTVSQWFVLGCVREGRRGGEDAFPQGLL